MQMQMQMQMQVQTQGYSRAYLIMLLVAVIKRGIVLIGSISYGSIKLNWYSREDFHAA